MLYSYICVCEAIYLCPLCDLATSRAAANMAKDQPLDKLRHHVSFVLHVSDLLLQLIDLYTRRMFVEFIRCYSLTGLTTPTLKALTNELKSVSDWYTLGVNLNFKTYQLRTIESNHPVDSNRRKIEMLSCCLDHTSNPNWF